MTMFGGSIPVVEAPSGDDQQASRQQHRDGE
jgi:hypothetical protein